MLTNSYHPVRQPFAILILAAGQSQRLGQPKQLLKKNGKTLLDHFIEMALGLHPERLVVIINQTLKGIELKFNQFNIEFILNADSENGMSSSLQVGAAALKNDRRPVLIMGIDQPLLTKNDLQILLNTSMQYPQCQVVSEYADTIGIPAVIQPELLAASHRLTGDMGLKRLLLQQVVAPVQVKAPQLAFDIDTPDDLTQAQQAGWIDLN